MKGRLVTLPSLLAWALLAMSLTFPLSVRAEGGEVNGMRLADWEKNGHRIISGPLSVEALERESLEAMKKNPHVPQAPSGNANDEWERLKAGMRPGDEIYRVDFLYRVNDHAPETLGGWGGLIWVRDGIVVGSLAEVLYE